MAGSRRESVGSILKRKRIRLKEVVKHVAESTTDMMVVVIIQGLLRSGAMKNEDRPIWYDVVKAIPPKPLPPPKQVQKILYPEDFVRVQFHRVYQNTGALSLRSSTVNKSIQERFVDTYLELHQKEEVPPDELFEKTAQILMDKGIKLVRRDVKSSTEKPVPPQPQKETKTQMTLDIDKLFAEKT